MQRNRLNLQTLLETLLGSKHVYYQPPESIKMEYPAIRYLKDDIVSKYANNNKYLSYDLYNIIVISKKPDDPVIKKILDLPNTEFDRHYISDNLNHDVIKMYY